MSAEFERVYWQTVGAIEASHDALVALMPALLAGHRAGNPRQMQDAVRQFLPDGSWRWPAYDAYMAPSIEKSRREEMRDIRQCDLSEFLVGMRADRLKALCKAHLPAGAKSPGKNKVEIASSLLALLLPAQHAALLADLREEAVTACVNRFPDYREMGLFMVRRIETIMHAEMRYVQLSDPGLLSFRPRWRFHWSEGGAKDCRKFDDKALPVEDARRVFPRIPCECLDCGCYIVTDK